MGLAAAFYALKRGYTVDVIESENRPGGMASHFDFGGLSIERFYHFCCLSDVDTLLLLEELGIQESMKWVSTKMGYFIDGELIQWGSPLALLFAPKIGLITKIRYGAHIFLAARRRDWRKLDGISARDWLISGIGNVGYDKLWRSLLEKKFFEFSNQISAAWVGCRIKRLSTSRKSLFQERLGYIDGGSETLVMALVRSIEDLGGQIHYSARAVRFLTSSDRVIGVQTNHGTEFAAPNVISTIPIPYAQSLFDEKHAKLRIPYNQIKNIGVVCVVHKLRRSVSENFWVNISDDHIDIPGFVEFSNLRPLTDHIVYVPYYMPQSHEKYQWSDSDFVEESFDYLRRVNPNITASDRIASHVGRLRYAQPVCEIGFSNMIPDNITPLAGLQVADTCFYYPEDRGISESVRYAKLLVEGIPKSRRTDAET